MSHRIAAIIPVLALVALVPGRAEAQYKNSSFGLDAGYLLLSKPSLTNSSGSLLPLEERPVRLSNGFRLSGETNFKMADDHWWFSARVNVAMMRFNAPAGLPDIDVNDLTQDDVDTHGLSETDIFFMGAEQKLGTILGVEGEMGVRYVILTDRFRPYVQLGLSYNRLLSFSSLAESSCDAASLEVICADGASTSYYNAILPHRNIGGLHLRPGFNWVFRRDMALHVFVDLQRWIIYNAADNNGVVFGLGLTFFS